MPVSRNRLALAFAFGALAFLGGGGRARADLRSVLVGRVRDVVAAGDGVVALVDDELVVPDADGARVRGRVRARARDGRRPSPP